MNDYMIDTHCHLDDAAFESDIDSVIAEANTQHIHHIIIPAADVSTLPKAREIAHQYERVYFASGAHPNELEGFDIDLLESFVSDSKCVAVGECGLDYHYLPKNDEEAQSHIQSLGLDSKSDLQAVIAAIKTRQKHCFKAQIELALKYDLPLIIHIREASNDCFEILQDYPRARGVLHCFNADRILLHLSERFYYGIGGVCTFKNARRLIEVLPLIPKDKIVLETDAPYLAPEPHRGKRNEPRYIPLIASKIAEILQIHKNEIIHLSTDNAMKLFNLKNALPKAV